MNRYANDIADNINIIVIIIFVIEFDIISLYYFYFLNVLKQSNLSHAIYH